MVKLTLTLALSLSLTLSLRLSLSLTLTLTVTLTLTLTLTRTLTWLGRGAAHVPYRSSKLTRRAVVGVESTAVLVLVAVAAAEVVVEQLVPRYAPLPTY